MSKTYEEILQGMLDKVPSDVDKQEGSVIYDALAPCAYFLAQQDFQLENYSEHALGSGADARAVALIALRFPEEGTLVFGAGMDGNVNLAAVSGIVSALNRRGAKGDVKK